MPDAECRTYDATSKQELAGCCPIGPGTSPSHHIADGSELSNTGMFDRIYHAAKPETDDLNSPSIHPAELLNAMKSLDGYVLVI